MLTDNNNRTFYKDRTCAVCKAEKTNWGYLCRKHYRYYDFDGKALKRIVDKESRWRKERLL
jgi:hypothetical protein